MQKYFNIAGPCHPGKHYMVPILERNKDILPLIEQEQYFVIHAARQSGKTTLVKTLVNQLNVEGRYYALYCSLEEAHTAKRNLDQLSAAVEKRVCQPARSTLPA